MSCDKLENCVDEMMNNGCQFCPGITSDCKIELLSTVQLDYRANKQISQLKMKCPEEMCSYEKLIEHFQLENINHNKTLIDIIDNIKNEVGKNHEEINKLKSNLQLKDEKLESINTEMEMMKKEKLKMENRLKEVEEMFNVEITKLKSKHEKEIESIKSELIEKIEILQRNFDNKIDEIELTNKKEIKSINDEIRLEINQKINQLEIHVENKMKGIFEMMIDNIYDLRYNVDNIDYLRNDIVQNGICSEYFYTRYPSYKLQLLIYPLSDKLCIYLRIHDDVINRYLLFPFKANVTIKVTNKNNRGKSESITKYCQIQKAENNSYNESDQFVYQYSELTESGILESNSCFIVECCVKFRKDWLLSSSHLE